MRIIACMRMPHGRLPKNISRPRPWSAACSMMRASGEAKAPGQTDSHRQVGGLPGDVKAGAAVMDMSAIAQPVRDSYLVFGSPQILEAEIEEVVATLRSAWIGTGPRV